MKKVLQELERLRTKIDKEDKIILAALSRRQQVSKKIGLLKKNLGLPVYQQKREVASLESRLRIGHKLGLSVELVSKLFKLVFSYSKKVQRVQKSHKGHL